jgi:uncharacterized damage-inducible protein DinB
MSLNKYAIVLLNQVVTILNQLNNDQYAMELEILSKGSIGKHVRHILEFYECMLNGIESGKINYDKRQRNISLETDVDFAINCIHTLTDTILQLNDTPLILQVEYDGYMTELTSSVFRELSYNIEHTVHHLAILKIGLRTNLCFVNIDENLGIAYSTQKFNSAN